MWNILLSAYTRGFPAEGKKWLGAVSLRPIDIAHTGIEKNKKFLQPRELWTTNNQKSQA